MKQYIKVDLYGQFDDDTRHEFTYPSKLVNQYSFTEATVWAKSISDPRALHGKICKAGADCYVIWGNEYGNYFSYITRNSRDSRGGNLSECPIFLPHGQSPCSPSDSRKNPRPRSPRSCAD